MNTSDRKALRTIVFSTYGKNEMSKGLADRLEKRIPAFDEDPAYRSREDMIREICWMWFSGGSTAASVAREIEEAFS